MDYKLKTLLESIVNYVVLDTFLQIRSEQKNSLFPTTNYTDRASHVLTCFRENKVSMSCLYT